MRVRIVAAIVSLIIASACSSGSPTMPSDFGVATFNNPPSPPPPPPGGTGSGDG